MVLFTHIRLAHSFGSYETRLQCVQARLQALSVLVYCNALQVGLMSVLLVEITQVVVCVVQLKV